MIFIAILTAALLYWNGWLRFTQTGVLKPLVNLTILGFTVEIRKPESDDTEG